MTPAQAIERLRSLDFLAREEWPSGFGFATVKRDACAAVRVLANHREQGSPCKVCQSYRAKIEGKRAA